MTRRTTSRISRAAALLAACALAASLSSCGRSDPVAEEIDRVSVGLGAISTSGSTPVGSVEYRKSVYQWAINRLTGAPSPRDPILSDIADTQNELKGQDRGRPARAVPDAATPSVRAVDSGNPGQAAAANLLVARSHAGLAEIAAQQAALLESRAARQISPIRAALDQWLAQNAAADAMAAYDPAPQFAAIDTHVAEKQRLAEAQRAARARQLAVVADLEAQAAALDQQARALREQQAEIRAGAAGVSETQRLELIIEANRIGRDADQIERQSAELLAQAALERPRADEMDRAITELSTQIELLGADRESLRARADQSAAAAKRARDEARLAADRLTTLVADMEASRTALAGPTDEAVRAYTQAIAAARKAGQFRDAKANAAVIAGTYQHMLGDVLATRARGLRGYADLLSSLAAARPALPGAADYSSKAAAASSAAGQAEKDAAEALRAAKDLYASGGGSGDTQDRLRALSDALGRLLGEAPTPIPDDAPAPADDAPDMTEPDDDATAAAPAADDHASAEAEVRAAVDRMIAASRTGDIDAFKQLVFVRDQQHRATVDAIIEASAGPGALDRACNAAYGKPIRELIEETSVQSIKSNPMVMMLLQRADALSMSPGELDSLSGADVPVNVVSPTEAHVDVPGELDDAQTLVFVKDGGAWRVDADSILAELGGTQALGRMAPMLEMIKAMGVALTTVAGKVDDASYADSDAMLIDLNKELLAAMARAAGGNGGNGGNGGGGGG